MFCDAAPLDRCRGPARRRIKIEVLPGFEPGSLDSKSRVLTNYTIRPRCVKNMVIVGLEPTTLGLLDPCSTI